MSEKRITCWHFLADDKRLRWGTKEVAKVGKTYSAEGPLKICENGMHGSRRLIDALQYAPGAILCKVQIWGEIEKGDDKLVGRNRKVLAMVDATKMLHEAACHFAEQALKFVDCKDEHSWSAIKTKRAWLKGKATNKELSVARDAAKDAAWAVAWDAAKAVAWDAAKDPAWSAARDTAWGTAWSAARDAARGTAWSAARDAARDAQTKYLEARAEKLFRSATEKGVRA